MPHFRHAISLAVVEVKAGVITGVVADILTMSSRSGIGRRETYCSVDSVVNGVGVGGGQTVDDNDPRDPSKIALPSLLAFEWTQAAPQRICLNDAAS